MPQKLRPWQVLPREALKIMAMLFMLLDHAYMTVVAVPGFGWMTMVGRLAFPIFAFQVAEGYTHTSGKKRYLCHMLGFALLSELPFDLMMCGELFNPLHQNVLFTFVLAILMLLLIDKLLGSNLTGAIKVILVAGVCVLAVVAGTLCFVDYSGLGVFTVILFYLARRAPNGLLTAGIELIGLYVINAVLLGGQVIPLVGGIELPVQGLALLALPVIWCYNGKKVLSGRANTVFQYTGYLFYPLHILLLSLAALYL